MPSVSDKSEEDQNYQLKRSKNNQAVRKSRVKKKQRAMDTKRQLEKLKTEKVKLEQRIQQKEKEKSLLKDLFLEAAQIKSKSNPNLNLEEILRDDDVDDDKDVVSAVNT